MLLSPFLLCTSAIGCYAIRDLETFPYSPLRGNILGCASLCVGAWALYRALVRPEGHAFLSEYGEPKTLHQAEPGTKSPAQLISTSDADELPQKCVKARSRLLPSKLSEDLPLWHKESEDCHSASIPLSCTPSERQSSSRQQYPRLRPGYIKEKRSGDFRLSPPANFANSAILPEDKISTFFMQNFLLQKPKDSTI